MSNIISNTDSEITHVLENDILRHIIIKTVLVANDSRAPEYDQYFLQSSSHRKIISGEFAGYYEGRLYEHVYYRFLD